MHSESLVTFNHSSAEQGRPWNERVRKRFKQTLAGVSVALALGGLAGCGEDKADATPAGKAPHANSAKPFPTESVPTPEPKITITPPAEFALIEDHEASPQYDSLNKETVDELAGFLYAIEQETGKKPTENLQNVFNYINTAIETITNKATSLEDCEILAAAVSPTGANTESSQKWFIDQCKDTLAIREFEPSYTGPEYDWQIMTNPMITNNPAEFLAKDDYSYTYPLQKIGQIGVEEEYESRISYRDAGGGTGIIYFAGVDVRLTATNKISDDVKQKMLTNNAGDPAKWLPEWVKEPRTLKASEVTLSDGRETRWHIALTPLSFERAGANGQVERVKYWIPEAMKPQAKDWDEFFN